jgi:hypothetical protein
LVFEHQDFQTRAVNVVYSKDHHRWMEMWVCLTLILHTNTTEPTAGTLQSSYTKTYPNSHTPRDRSRKEVPLDWLALPNHFQIVKWNRGLMKLQKTLLSSLVLEEQRLTSIARSWECNTTQKLHSYIGLYTLQPSIRKEYYLHVEMNRVQGLGNSTKFWVDPIDHMMPQLLLKEQISSCPTLHGDWTHAPYAGEPPSVIVPKRTWRPWHLTPVIRTFWDAQATCTKPVLDDGEEAMVTVVRIINFGIR